MELDARLLITLGGMLISVITSFVVTRQKCVELEEDSKTMQRQIAELFDNLEKNNISTQVAENRVNVLSGILHPDKLESQHKTIAKMESDISYLRSEVTRLNHMHNGKHPVIKGD
jgi:hypothetical protein